MAFVIMERFHQSISKFNTWAVYGALRRFYDDEEDIFEVKEDNAATWHSWEQLWNKEIVTWLLPKVHMDVVVEFKTSVLPHVTVEEYEAYAIGNAFLLAMLEDNVMRMPIMCSNFNDTTSFLYCIEHLYFQKFNIPKIKIMLNSLFFNVADVDNDDDLFNIACMLSNVTNVKPTIKAKKLLPFVRFMDEFEIKSEQNMLIDVIRTKFWSTDIMTITEFRDFCATFDAMSKEYKKSPTQATLKDLMIRFDNKKRCNNINKLYGNILLLGLFAIKEENLTHHKVLYDNLKQILKCLSIC